MVIESRSVSNAKSDLARLDNVELGKRTPGAPFVVMALTYFLVLFAVLAAVIMYTITTLGI